MLKILDKYYSGGCANEEFRNCKSTAIGNAEKKKKDGSARETEAEGDDRDKAKRRRFYK